MDVVGSMYQRDRESYEEQRDKAFLGFEKRYKSKWRNSIGFRAEGVEVDDLDDDARNRAKNRNGA